MYISRMRWAQLEPVDLFHRPDKEVFMAAKYRADHIGSLLRPAELLQARGANSDTVSNCAHSKTSTSCESSSGRRILASRSLPTASCAAAIS